MLQINMFRSIQRYAFVLYRLRQARHWSSKISPLIYGTMNRKRQEIYIP